MKKGLFFKLCQMICILLFFLLLSHSALVLHYAKRGLFSWAFSVLPVLFPFILLSKFWIYFRLPQSIYRIALRLLPRHGLLAPPLTVLCLGLCTGFPVGAVFICHFYEKGLLSKEDGERLLPLCSFVSPMFLAGYVRPLFSLDDRTWLCFLVSLYVPLLLFFWAEFLCRKNDGQPRPGTRIFLTAKKEAAPHIREIWLSSLEIIFMIGIYMMLFSILSGMVLEEPLFDHWVAGLFLCNLEVTTGVERLALLGGLPSVVRIPALCFVVAFGGLCTAAQIYSVIYESRLSMKKYFGTKGACGLLSALLFWVTQLIWR